MTDADEKKRFQGLMSYYRERVIKAKCNGARLNQAVEDLVDFFLQELSKERSKAKRTTGEVNADYSI